MGDRSGENALHDGPASVAEALASGRRAELVDVLAQGERRVDDLAVGIGQSVANTSHHPQTLSPVGAVRLVGDAGRPAVHLDDGCPERAGAGQPVEGASA